MFLEIELDSRTGQEKGQREISREELLEQHPTNSDLRSWAQGARIGSVFSLMAQGYKYKRLPE